jgi:ubiquinone biosynthesis protein Coq4
VPLHDLHHILTEYGTTWRGEAEISTWEVSSGGLRGFWAGWILDLMNVAQGLVINPRGVYAAFMRGRQTTNLFGTDFDERILDHSVGDLRASLKLDEPIRAPRFTDRMAFVCWALTSIAVYLTAVLIPCLPLIAVFWILFG